MKFQKILLSHLDLRLFIATLPECLDIEMF